MPQEVSLGGTDSGFRGRKFEVVLSQPFEERAHITDMLQRAFVKNNDVIEVCLDSIESFDYFVNHFYKVACGLASTHRHAEPFEQTSGGRKGRKGDSVLVDGDLVEGARKIE